MLSDRARGWSDDPHITLMPPPKPPDHALVLRCLRDPSPHYAFFHSLYFLVLCVQLISDAGRSEMQMITNALPRFSLTVIATANLDAVHRHP
jgi:hypothetical protein